MIRACNIGPEQGFMWNKGFCYTGPFARQQALRDGILESLDRQKAGGHFDYGLFDGVDDKEFAEAVVTVVNNQADCNRKQKNDQIIGIILGKGRHNSDTNK